MLHEFAKNKRAKMKWAIETQRKFCERPFAVEEVVDLFDRDQQWVTSGTVDLAGWSDYDGAQLLSLIDWKPGDYIDRWGQMFCYGLAFMDALDQRVFQGVLAYYKTRGMAYQLITYREAEERVLKLIARLRGESGPEYHAINEWCSFCAVRMSEAGCPAWEEHRALLAQSGWPVELEARLASIKNDPEKVARFIIADRRWRALVDAHELDDIIRPVLEANNGKAHGLKLQSRGFSIVIDESAQTPKQLDGGNSNA